MKRNNIFLLVLFTVNGLLLTSARALEVNNDEAAKYNVEYKKVPSNENNNGATKRSLNVETPVVDLDANLGGFNADLGVGIKNNKNEGVRKLIVENKDLLSSFEKCSALKQKIKADFNMGIFGAMFKGLDSAFDIEIKGLNNNNNCDFEVKNLVEDIEISKYVCSFNKEQINELKEALLDDSGKEISRKVKTTKTYNQNNINSTMDFSFEVKGDPAFVVWSDLSSRFCEAKHHKMTEDEEKIISKKMMMFSKDFNEKLKKCEPGKEDKSVVFVSIIVEVVGRENGKCHIKTDPFELYLNDEQLSKISSVVDLTELYSDDKVAVYNPKYNSFGILTGLSKCLKNENNGSYTGGTETATIGKGVSIKKGIQIKRIDNGCEVRFGNILTRNNTPKGYGKKCVVPFEKATQFIDEYKNLLPNDNEFQFGTKTIEADKKIASDIETQYCN